MVLLYYILSRLLISSVSMRVPTNVRWTSEPKAIVLYFSIVGDVYLTVVIAADVVLFTSSSKRRIGDFQQIVYSTVRKDNAFTHNELKLN